MVTQILPDVPDFVILHGSIIAGMPVILPEDLPTFLRLNDEPHQRLQAISFFLLGIAATAFAVKLLWNTLARDIPALPRLSLSKAFSVVVLSGLMFVVVLTMISGARELMTPGAWQKTGLTYTLKDRNEAEKTPLHSSSGKPE